MSLFLKINGTIMYLAVITTPFIGINRFATAIKENPINLFYILATVYALFLFGTLFVTISGIMAADHKRRMNEEWVGPHEKIIQEIVSLYESGDTTAVKQRSEELEALLPGFSDEVDKTAGLLTDVCENLVSEASHNERKQRIKEIQALRMKASAIQKKLS